MVHGLNRNKRRKTIIQWLSLEDRNVCGIENIFVNLDFQLICFNKRHGAATLNWVGGLKNDFNLRINWWQWYACWWGCFKYALGSWVGSSQRWMIEEEFQSDLFRLIKFRGSKTHKLIFYFSFNFGSSTHESRRDASFGIPLTKGLEFYPTQI